MLLLVAAIAAFAVAFDVRIIVVRPLCGLLLVVVIPAYLLYRGLYRDRASSPAAALIYAMATVLLAIMLVGLAMNTVLPILGLTRPLDRIPTLIAAVLLNGVCVLVVEGIPRFGDGAKATAARVPPSAAPPGDQCLMVMSGSLVVLSVAGAVRLNNGANGVVSTVALAGAAAVLAVLLWRRNALRENTILACIYLVSTALLFMTSLRGWFITGHDIQREYRVFELTADHGLWAMEWYRSAYNACLSITILPTMIANLSGMPHLYVFKVVFQLIFAMAPVMVYLIARRSASRFTALLGTVFFIAFPTFFTDMPFLDRQEIAFVFLGAAILMMTDQEMSLRARRWCSGALMVGVVLSHYSTAYVLVAVLSLAWFALRAKSLVESTWATRRRDSAPTPLPVQWVVTVPLLIPLAALSFIWFGPVTGTGDQLQQTLRTTFSALGDAAGARSSDTAYSLFSRRKPTPEERLSEYSQQAMALSADGRTSGDNYPLEMLAQYPTPVVHTQRLPVTEAGHLLERSGIRVSELNDVLRAVAPKLLQLFVVAGFVLVIAKRSHRFSFRPGAEFVAMAGGALTIISAQVILPNVSVDYGLLRTFAQGLFWLAPFLGVGSVALLSWLGRSRAATASGTLAIVFFLSQTGFVPQTLGGYPPQLNLNDAGQYFDNYYLHAEEQSAMEWLQRRIDTDTASTVQSEVITDRYTFSRLQNYAELRAADDIFPALLRRDAFVFLGYTTTRKGEVTISHDGDLVTYRYPTRLLDATRDLIYSSAGARIYR